MGGNKGMIEPTFQDYMNPKYVVALDAWGYRSLYTWEKWCETYGFTAPEYLPIYHTFEKEEDAIKYRDQQNEYTKNRINNG